MKAEFALIAVSFALLFVAISGRDFQWAKRGMNLRNKKSSRLATPKLEKDSNYYRNLLKMDEEYRNDGYVFRPKRVSDKFIVVKYLFAYTALRAHPLGATKYVFREGNCANHG